MKDRQYCVYIMTNAHNTVLYTGVTNCLQRRVLEHKSGKGGVFTKRYNITKLVYYQWFTKLLEEVRFWGVWAA